MLMKNHHNLHSCWDENHSKSNNHMNIPMKKDISKNQFSMSYGPESLSKCHSVSSRTSSSFREPSPTPSDWSSSDVSVSSLLQKWRGLEAEARHINHKFHKNTYIIEKTQQQQQQQQCMSYNNNEQPQQQQLQQPRQHERVSSRGEINVADMVRTWATTNQVTCEESFQEKPPSFEDCLARLRTKMDIREQSLIISSSVVCSPKLRGRQAISDLFVKMEKQRYQEIQLLASFCLVTKFPQRGRIQSLLRLKYLRQEVLCKQEQGRPVFESKQGGSNTSNITYSINMLRERFCEPTKQDTKSNQYIHNNACIGSDGATTTQEIVKKSGYDKPFEQTNYQGEIHTNNLLVKNTSMQSKGKVDQLHENSTIINVNNEDFQQQNVERQVTSMEEDAIYEYENENELENNDQQYFGNNNLDWIIDIARPRVYWEDQRKAWYHEIINTPSKNEDIRLLIKRGNVSSILGSSFREKMERIMMSTVQRIMCSSINEGEEGPSMKPLLEHTSRMDEYREKDDENDETNESESNSQLEQYRDVSDYEQTPSPSPSPSRPWNPYLEDEPSDVDFDHISSSSLKQPSINHSYYCHPLEGSSSTKNISSIEMELIYDLRTHMQQLYQEMFELRKSITSCMVMQFKLQNSIKDEVSTAINHLDGDKSKSNGRHSKRGFCCICYEKKIDSLLYRCGHMCTCFDCANELQWSSGKCPICRAQIVDVVRTYHDK